MPPAKQRFGSTKARPWVDPHQGEALLEDWAARWMASRLDLKPRTRLGYESLLRNQVLPAFGRRLLSSIRPMDVQEWIAGMQTDGRSASQIRQATHLLGSIMKAAVAEGIIATNPCAAARLPRMSHKEVTFFTAAQVERIATAIRPPYDVLVYVLAYGGLRYGELAALRRNDCDLGRSRLRVDESLADVSGHLHFGSTKTHQRRFVTLPPFLCSLLEQHLEVHVGHDPAALLFTSPSGAPLRYNNFYRRSWARALRDADLEPAGLHSLRHTCASLLLAHGAPIKAVQAQLGHGSAELTLDRYGHLYPDQMGVVAERLEEARNRALAQPPDSRRAPHGDR